MKLPNFPSIKNFLIWVGGGDVNLISERAGGYKTLFAGLGSLILLTSVIAACSATVAAHAIFDNFGNLYIPEVISDAAPFIAIFVGLIYGLLIFSVDRLLVTTCPSLDEIKNQGKRDGLYFVVLFVLRMCIAIFTANQITTLLGVSLSQIEIYEDVKATWISRQLQLQKQADDQWKQAIAEEAKQLENDVQAMYTAVTRLAVPQVVGAASSTSNATSSRQMTNYTAQADAVMRSLQQLSRQPDSPQKRELSRIYNDYLKDIGNRLNYDSNNAKHLNDINEFEKKKSIIFAQVNMEAVLAVEFYKNKTEKSRTQINKLKDKYDNWIVNKKTVNDFGDEFNKCAFGKKNCEAPVVGVLTKVASFKSMENKSDGDNKFYLLHLLEKFLIFIELIALIIKVLVDKNDYTDELKKKTIGDRAMQDYKDQLRDLRTITEEANATMKTMTSSVHEFVEHCTDVATKSSQVITDANVRANMFNLLKNLGSVRMIKKWLDASDGQIASAAGVENNYVFSSDPKANNGLLPFYEDIPSADHINHSMKGNIKSSILRSVVFGCLTAVGYALVAYMDPAKLSFSAVTMVLAGVAVALMVGSVNMLATSPGFGLAAKSGMWLAVSIIILGGAIYLSTELMSNSTLPSDLQKIIGFFGGTAGNILLKATFLLLALFLFGAVKKRLNIEKTALPQDDKNFGK